MPSFEVEFSVYCGRCGAGLCNYSETATGHRGSLSVSVEPCAKCLKSERDEGYDEGYDEGHHDGVEEATEQ